MKPTLDALKFCRSIIHDAISSTNLRSFLKKKDREMANLEKDAYPEMVQSVLEAHKVLCNVKNMGTKEAFGHDPAVFYGLALSGECGELANQLIKVIRVGGTRKEKRAAVESEVADVLIYAILLAYTNDINPHKVVNEKSAIVVQRALSGYYGKALHKVKKKTAKSKLEGDLNETL